MPLVHTVSMSKCVRACVCVCVFCVSVCVCVSGSTYD